MHAPLRNLNVLTFVLFFMISCVYRGQNGTIHVSSHKQDTHEYVPTEAWPAERILAEINSDFSVLESTWFSKGPRQTPNMEGFVQGLLSLARTDRPRYDEVREAVLKGSLKLSDSRQELSQQIKLAIHDPDTWQSYFDSFSLRGTPDPALKDALVPVLNDMPKSLRDEIYEKIRYRYGDAMRHKYDLSVAHLGERKGLSPKRAIDAFVRHTVDAQSFFQGAKSPEEVTESYRKFLSFKRDRLFSNTEFCEYTADDVISILLALQRMIGTSWEKYGRSRGFGPESQNAEAYLLFMGSFVNCHAQLSKDDDTTGLNVRTYDPDYSKSDLDLYVAPEKMIQSLLRFESRLYSALVSPQAQKFKATPGLKARLQMHPYRPVEALDASTLSPIFLRLRQKDLLIYVYPPIRFSDLPQDRSLLTLPDHYSRIIQQPACYAVKGAC